jgi:cytochrome c553
MTLRCRRWAVLALAVLVAPWTSAQPASPAAELRLASLAGSCAQCHGTEGRPPAGSALPALAGRPAAELAARLKAFKSGAAPGTVMPQIAKGYSDTQIDALAGYFAARVKGTP